MRTLKNKIRLKLDCNGREAAAENVKQRRNLQLVPESDGRKQRWLLARHRRPPLIRYGGRERDWQCAGWVSSGESILF